VSAEPQAPFVGIRMSSGLVALVSTTDARRIRAKRWYRQSYTRSDGTRNVYANCQVGGRIIGMHRFILGLTCHDKIFVDHINGDGLDNRRENLRLASHAENMRNRRPDRRARLIAEQQAAGPTPVFFDALRASDGAQSQIPPLEVWDFAVPPPKPVKPKVVRPLLSPQELTIVTLLSDGQEITEIAVALGVTVKTISTAKARACRKLKVRNSSNPVPLVDAARARGLIGARP
jgi:DNA-binding CsgD family transcriptional regulator